MKAVKRMDPDREVKVVSANGLQECKKMLMAAKAGKYNGYLLKGMACPRRLHSRCRNERCFSKKGGSGTGEDEEGSVF